MFGKNKREKLFKDLENAEAFSAGKINKICGKIYAIAQKGDGEAYYKLYKFAEGNLKNRDIDYKYRDWLGLLKNAAALEYPEAICEFYGRHGWDEAHKRIAMLEKAAASGYEKACIVLSEIYERAYLGYAKEGLEKLTEDECALNVIKWLTVAAEKGNTEAQIKLGNFLSREKGDLDGALKWFTLAAEKDESYAYYGMATVYKKKEEWYKAQKYYKIAADKGDMIAVYGLGEVLLPAGMYQDIDRGLKLIEEAANNGIMVAALRLSELYEKGEIVPQDNEKSVFWKNKFEELEKKFFKRNDDLEAQAEKYLQDE